MPFSSASAQVTVQVQSVSITLDALPAQRAAGQSVTFTGRVTLDGVGAAGRVVQVVHRASGVVLGNPTTAADGSYSTSWMIPWSLTDILGTVYTLPCNTWEFYAYTPGAQSPNRSMDISYPTRIRNLTAPTPVQPNVAFAYQGWLEYQNTPTTWVPLAGRSVAMTFDGGIGTLTTATDGRFAGSYTPTVTGTFTLRASYAGQSLPLHLGPSEQTFRVAVGDEVLSFLLWLLPIIVGAGMTASSEAR